MHAIVTVVDRHQPTTMGVRAALFATGIDSDVHSRAPQRFVGLYGYASKANYTVVVLKVVMPGSKVGPYLKWTLEAYSEFWLDLSRCARS